MIECNIRARAHDQPVPNPKSLENQRELRSALGSAIWTGQTLLEQSYDTRKHFRGVSVARKAEPRAHPTLLGVELIFSFARCSTIQPSSRSSRNFKISNYRYQNLDFRTP